jgi:hypothetical protein
VVLSFNPSSKKPVSAILRGLPLHLIFPQKDRMYEIQLRKKDTLFYEDGGYRKMDITRGNLLRDNLANARPAPVTTTNN